MLGTKDNQKKAKQIHWIILVIYYIGAIAGFYSVISSQAGRYLFAMSIISFVLPWIPYLLFHMLHWRAVYLVYIIYNVFVFIAVPFASILGGYDYIPHLDKLLHCLSGFLFAVVGMIVFYELKEDKRLHSADAPLAAAFSAMTAITSAAVWEFYEYFVSFSGADPQQVMTTGIRDTMQDMIVCTVGGIITAFLCYRYLKTGKKELLMSLFEAFYQENIQPKQK